MLGSSEQQTETYEPPALTEIGSLVTVAKGQYSRPHSDDSDAGGYWSP